MIIKPRRGSLCAADRAAIRRSASAVDLDVTFADIRAANNTYAVRHVIIAPTAPMTAADMLAVADRLAGEIGVNMQRAAIVTHRKARAETSHQRVRAPKRRHSKRPR